MFEFEIWKNRTHKQRVMTQVPGALNDHDPLEIVCKHRSRQEKWAILLTQKDCSKAMRLLSPRHSVCYSRINDAIVQYMHAEF